MKDRKVNENMRQELLVPPHSDMTDSCRRKWSGYVQKCPIPWNIHKYRPKKKKSPCRHGSDGQLCNVRTSVFGLLPPG